MTIGKDRGFTLIEVIVALVVLGFVLAGLAQATRFGIAAWGVETKMADNAAGLERMDRVLRRLVEQASPPIAADDKPSCRTSRRPARSATRRFRSA
jgi:general secretion pathway protein J